jgi:hypothetical protein
MQVHNAGPQYSNLLELEVIFLRIPERYCPARLDEWYHWIGLEKDINRDRFLIFLIHS